MKLHHNLEDFTTLAILAANFIGVPEQATRRDYYMVLMLQNLEHSNMAEQCVFKGGTSLSKCYPGSINRFSEDIDLTFIPTCELKNSQYNKALKEIEAIMSKGANVDKISGERNDRNKSSWVWFPNEDKDTTKIKLEIGSSVRPDPYEKRTLKTYIQEYLEDKDLDDVIEEYELVPVSVNTLCIERTFLDKVMAVKRHAICGSLGKKVRHIYDVTRLFELPEIQAFLANKEELRRLIEKTKSTDSFYLQKRNIAKEYHPTDPYNFDSWNLYFDDTIRNRYEHLHEDLLYTNLKQDFNQAIEVFNKINQIFAEINE